MSIEFGMNRGPRLGKFLQFVRKSRGITQTGVAEKMGCTRQTVSKIERGDMSITVDTLERYCKAIGVRLENIVRSVW